MSVRLQMAVELVPKFTGFLSFCGSSWIVFEVLSDPKKRTHVYHRILLMMSVFDCVTSFGWIMSSWPVNPEKSPHTVFAAGNDITCNLQGFFWQLCYGTFLYNGFLSLYYLLLIRYNWSARKIARKIEPWYHGFVLILSLGTAVAGLPLELYNSLGQSCWIGAYPPDCKQSFLNGGVTDCERGDNAIVYAWAFLIIWVWASIMFSTVAMFLMYLSVWSQERKNKRYDFERSEGGGNASGFAAGASSERSQQTQRPQLTRSDAFRRWKQKKSTQVAKSCLLYLGAFYVVWLGSLIFEVLRTIRPVYVPTINLYMVVTLPLQGSMNFLVYIRPRYNDYRKRNPDAPMFVLARKSLLKSFILRRRRRKNDPNDDDFEIVAEVPHNFNDENEATNYENERGGGDGVKATMADQTSERRFDSEEEEAYIDGGTRSGGERDASMFSDDNPAAAATAAARRSPAQVGPDDDRASTTSGDRCTIKFGGPKNHCHGNAAIGLTRRNSNSEYVVSLSETTIEAI